VWSKGQMQSTSEGSVLWLGGASFVGGDEGSVEIPGRASWWRSIEAWRDIDEVRRRVQGRKVGQGSGASNGLTLAVV